MALGPRYLELQSEMAGLPPIVLVFSPLGAGANLAQIQTSAETSIVLLSQSGHRQGPIVIVIIHSAFQRFRKRQQEHVYYVFSSRAAQLIPYFFFFTFPLFLSRKPDYSLRNDLGFLSQRDISSSNDAIQRYLF